MEQGIGSAAFAKRDWQEAYALLSASPRASLGPRDLERLGLVAQLLGFEDEGTAVWEQAYQSFVSSDASASAARCAFWLGMTFMDRGQMAHASGWFARGHSVLEETDTDCPERAYFRIPNALQLLDSGSTDESRSIFLDVLDVARKFADIDLLTLGRLGNGFALTRRGDIHEGVTQLDEAMVSVLSDEVSPLVAGIVYCAVIEVCREIFDLRRAQEWTDALTRWCDKQPGLVPFRGKCQVYRSEVMQRYGDWESALEAALEAGRQLSGPPANPAVGDACYQQGELHRLRGAFSDADDAFRRAEEWGRRPEPGRALLRLQQGNISAAATAIRHALNESQRDAARAALLPAAIEILAAAHDEAGCLGATNELGRIAGSLRSPWLDAAAATAAGRVALAFGDPAHAISHLRGALTGWQMLQAPYEVARTRILLAGAAKTLGDPDTANAQSEAGWRELHRLGIRGGAMAQGGGFERKNETGLTTREVEILQLIARGMTNRAIASSLTLSERTVANHVGNILGKLGLSSRSAATAYAYEHGLVKSPASRPE